jgi:type IV secretory pathway TraG/TraD family ATPase VirD4
MWWGYKAAGRAMGGGARAGAGLGNGLNSALTLRRAGRGARRGYLVPGDPAPPPTASVDYLDYRGVAAWEEARNLADGTFGLGMFADLRRGRPRGPIGLPPAALNRHAVVIGPAGSGKTRGVLIPWMHAGLTAGWSVVALDVKGDLREEFLEYRRHAGAIPGARLRKWDFTDTANSTSWSWLAELTDDARIDAAITALIGRPPERSSVDPYFYQRDYRTLRGLLRFVRATAPKVTTAGHLVHVLQDQPRLTAAVNRQPGAPGVNDLAAVLSFPPGDYGKVISGVVTALSALDLPAVDTVTARRQLNLEETLSDHHLLIVVAPLRGGQVSATVSGLLLNQLKQRMFERFGQGGRPVLLVIDEAAQVTDRVDIAQLMEVARSAGVGVVVALQDASKLRDEGDRSSILSNAASFVILPGSSPLTVDAFSKRLGQRFERTHGLTAGGPRQGWSPAPPQQTFSTEAVPVLREREIMHVPFGARPALVHVNAHELGITAKPLIVDLYQEPVP